MTPLSPSAIPSAVLLGLLALGSASAEIDFNRDVRPILSNRCIACHGPDEEERKAKLRLDTPEGALDTLSPGEVEKSELFYRISTDDEDDLMPPPGKGKALDKAEQKIIRQWIEEGAKWDTHWSYTKPLRPAVPELPAGATAHNPIDHFVLDRLAQEGQKAAPEADRWTLARRVAVDLTGLPPTPEEARAFVEDKGPEAYERYVDGLLAKPTFGERWARVWLDLARYADSAGFADDPLRTIWAYRDWVIRALNDNMPFDQFTIEQIAGDLLENPTDEQLVATAFHRNTLTNNEGGTDDEEFRSAAVVDRTNTTMAVWMGTTMACAQCHTHKYDPITHHDYFSFYDILNQSQDADKKNESPTLSIFTQEQRQQRAELEQTVTQLKAELEAPIAELEKSQRTWESEIGKEPQWVALKPISVTSREKAAVKVAEEGTITIPRGAATDLTTVELRTAREQEMTGLRLEVLPEQVDNFVLDQITASWAPEGADPGIAGRFVRIALPEKSTEPLQLAEVEVLGGGTNHAREGKATQSSNFADAVAARAIDGNTDGDYNKKSVAHTAHGKASWEVDLGATKPIDSIRIWNRTDGGDKISARIKGYTVQILDEKRAVVQEFKPEGYPKPDTTLQVGGARPVTFRAAFASHEQDAFPAASVLNAKRDPKTGWAIAPNQGKANTLVLLPAKPIPAGGTLTLRISQQSTFKEHTLSHFRLSGTIDPAASKHQNVPAEIRKLALVPPAERTPEQNEKLTAHYRTIAPELATPRAALAKAEKDLAGLKPATSVPVLRELEGKRRETHIHIRGNHKSLGDKVEAGVPEAFHPLPDGAKPDRLGLAKWLIDSSNPLTPRVIANRHWEQIFGVGIVLTSEEFGNQGDLPSHPELLDWLAVELVESGWDIKHLLRLLVTSATYRQDARVVSGGSDPDPFNRLLSRGPRVRLSAEMVRDHSLKVSGLLSDKMFGKPVRPPRPKLGLKAAFGGSTDWEDSKGEDRYRRGIYTEWRRSMPYPSMATFDATNREVCTVRRLRTNTPLQALVTLNDPAYIEAAQALARRVVAESTDKADTRSQIARALELNLVRPSHPAEVDRLLALYEDQLARYEADPAAAMAMATTPIGALPEVLAAPRAAALTVVCNVLLNLDEVFQKP